jgi:hypothetical protein
MHKAHYRRTAAWIFEDFPEGTTARAFQVFNTAWLRLWTPILSAPARRFLRRLAA